MARARLLLFLAFAACGGAPPSAPAVVAIPPSPVSLPPPAPNPACDEARALLPTVRSAAGKPDRRAVQAAKEARRLCPGLADPEIDRFVAMDEAARALHGDLRFLGPWLLEAVWKDPVGETRVWELGPGAPRLRARIEEDEIVLAARDRLRAEVGEDLVFVDPRAGTAVRVPGVSLFDESRDFVFVGNGDDIRRLRASDLAPAEEAKGSVDGHGARPGRVLFGGDVLVTGEQLVSFAPRSVLRAGVSFAGVRPDEARVLACDASGPAMVEIDTRTGAELVRFALPKDMDCAVAEPAYAPDPRYAFWIEQGRETKDAGNAIVVAAGDTRTGKVHRFEDQRATWSIAFHSGEHLDEDGRRLCADLRSFHGGWTLCEWKVTKDGRIARDPKPPAAPRPSLSALGLSGAVELARVWTPAHERLLVLTFREKGEEKHDLRLTVASARGKVERVVVLEAGEVLFDDARLREPWRAHEYVALPSVEPIDDGHAVFHHGFGPMEEMLVDLGTGAIEKPCSGRDECRVVGRFVVDPPGSLRDLMTGRAITLEAAAATWESAPHLAQPCP